MVKRGAMATSVQKPKARRLSVPAQTAIVGAVTLLLCLCVLRIWPSATDILKTPLFDGYQRLHPRASTDPPVAVLDIDEASIAELGQWPWSRQVIAKMVERLHGLDAAAIGFDIVFSEPDRLSLSRAVEALRKEGASVQLPIDPDRLDSDAALAKALSTANVSVGLALTDETRQTLPRAKAAFSFGGSDPRLYLPQFSSAVRNLDILHDAAAGAGFFSFSASRDNVIRTMPLVSVAGGALFPALSIETLRLAQGASGLILRGSDASGEKGGSHPGLVNLWVGALTVPTMPDGRLRIYYSGLAGMTVISAADLLSNRLTPAQAQALSGRIVLIGTSAIGLRDIVATPLAAAVPGVNVHAEIIDQIMAGVFLQEPDWAAGLALLAGFTAGVLLIFIASRSGAGVSTLAFLLLSSALAALSWLAFAQAQILIDPVGPVLTLLVIFLVLTPLRLALANREKQFVKNAFGRYLAPSLVERLAKEPHALQLGGETRPLTVLFSDIRGFTTLSEGMDPQTLTGLINNVLTPLTDVLLAREATIDKYIGDAIMAFWNAPLDIDAHEEKACRAALEMTKALKNLNQSRPEPIRIGIGLNSGPACVGNLGSVQRFSYSALGDSVNLASRIESLTKFYGVTIAVSEFTRGAVPHFAFLEIDFVRVKGRSLPVRLYVLLGDEAMAESTAFASLEARHQSMMALYYKGAFTEAQLALSALRTECPDELCGLYDLYYQRLSVLVADPPGEAWDGVYTARSK
ncbi:adenylate cyclase [Agrobacterium vitis]|nr:adenylate cyclase [Agrobacterium vitis]MBE1439480.1 adenylate cyclase [Agrobacterium vitis]